MIEIDTSAALRELYAEPKARTLKKVVTEIDRYCARFIALSPFCVLATVSAQGHPDMTPRGGAPGFVEVLNQQTLLLRDRPGNNRLDNLSNIVHNPAVTFLFFVPGIDETLRVYGTAAILPAGSFPEEPSAGRPSTTALRIAVTHAYFHCPKALMRSRFWSEEAQIDRGEFPTLGEIIKDQIGDPTPAESQEEMLRRYVPEM